MKNHVTQESDAAYLLYFYMAMSNMMISQYGLKGSISPATWMSDWRVSTASFVSRADLDAIRETWMENLESSTFLSDMVSETTLGKYKQWNNWKISDKLR